LSYCGKGLLTLISVRPAVLADLPHSVVVARFIKLQRLPTRTRKLVLARIFGESKRILKILSAQQYWRMLEDADV